MEQEAKAVRLLFHRYAVGTSSHKVTKASVNRHDGPRSFELGDIDLRLPHDLLKETVRRSETQAGTPSPGRAEDLAIQELVRIDQKVC